MRDTLRPNRKGLAARREGEDLKDSVIYGLLGPLGFSIKRLKLDRVDWEPVIWIWSDNPDDADRRHYLTRDEFEDEYDVIAWVLEVGQKL